MKTFSFEIKQDEYADNPRDEFDHISTFYGVSGRYMVGGKKDVTYRYSEDLSETIAELRKEKAVIVEFSSNAGTCYAVVERNQLQDEYLKYGYSMRKALYRARRCAQGEINEFLAWAEGEVYGFVVKDDETGETLDSCWGFYGDDGRKAAEDEAKSMIKYYEEEEQKQEDLLTSRLEFAANL